ncbi:hypothetical protein WA1_09340 [Scytonema hofmannii PCC 7110]|uniref:Bacteriocin n=1 Tax=Scytonema hofmannii PCC 7110 TaxID=128403 RepID=A0A139WSE0_9CYAN|nr:hypothetical protein [Scytonema hofmannii]KYC35339.1 hypothetical protein WA1_09340 [Scytonema hofmannii PCC 7110]
MLSVEKNEMFTEVTAEDCVTVSGGGPISYLFYSLLAQTPASPGGVAFTVGEIQDGWNILVNAGIPVNGLISP